MRVSSLSVVVVPLALFACADGGGGGTGTSAVVDADTSGGGDLIVPATVTMTTGLGGPISAGLCQNLRFEGGIVFSLETAPQCSGGAVYLTWFKDNAADTYSVVAGTILTVANDGGAVAIQTTNTGAVTKTGANEDTVIDLAAGSDITIETADHAPITFSLTGDDLTVSAFTAR